MATYQPQALAVILIIQQSAYWAYSVGMHTRYGQTVGKMVCKVKIVDAKTELPITFRQAFLRDAVPIVLNIALLPWDIQTEINQGLAPSQQHWSAIGFIGAVGGLWFLIEVVTMLSNERRRALHDFIAGTIVIRTNLQETGMSVAPEPAAQPA